MATSSDSDVLRDPTTQAAYAAYRARTRFGNLDGLRCICIAMVLWHHSNPFPESGLQLFKGGFLGVDFFFVLSGYLITTLLLREAATFGSFSLRDFYIRRLIRIVPPYFFVVTIVGAYFIFVKGQTELLEIWPYYYLFLSNFMLEHIPLLTITWSVALEEQYYLVWPLIMMFLPARFLWLFGAVYLIAAVFAILGAFDHAPPAAGPLLITAPNMLVAYAAIIMGSLAAVLLHAPASFAVLRAATGGYATALIGLVCVAVLIEFTSADVRGFPKLAIQAAMTVTLIALVVREDTILTPFLTHPLIARIGVVSYGIYLYHLVARDIVTRLGERLVGELDAWVVLIVYAILAYLMAEASFRTLEAWFRRYRPKPRTISAGIGVSGSSA